jgi:MFS family permease
MGNSKSIRYLVTISFVSTIGGFLFGYDIAIISGCNSFLQSHFHLTPTMLGWVVSSALLGTILGCIISGTIIDRFGRKKALILAA